MEKRTDLALEAHEIYAQEQCVDKIDGVDINTFTKDKVTVTRVKISDDKGSRALKKPVGDYVTLEIPEYVHETADNFDNIIKTFSESILESFLRRSEARTASSITSSLTVRLPFLSIFLPWAKLLLS